MGKSFPVVWVAGPWARLPCALATPSSLEAFKQRSNHHPSGILEQSSALMTTNIPFKCNVLGQCSYSGSILGPLDLVGPLQRGIFWATSSFFKGAPVQLSVVDSVIWPRGLHEEAGWVCILLPWRDSKLGLERVFLWVFLFICKVVSKWHLILGAIDLNWIGSISIYNDLIKLDISKFLNRSTLI